MEDPGFDEVLRSRFLYAATELQDPIASEALSSALFDSAPGTRPLQRHRSAAALRLVMVSLLAASVYLLQANLRSPLSDTESKRRLSDQNAYAPGSRRAGACPDPSPMVKAPSGVKVTLTLSKSVLAPGEPLEMRLVVRNELDQAVEYWHGGSPFDIWIENESGRVWQWTVTVSAGGAAFRLALVPALLAPYSDIVKTITWRHETCASPLSSVSRLPAGQYHAQAMWTGTTMSNDYDGGGWWSDPVAFEIR